MDKKHAENDDISFQEAMNDVRPLHNDCIDRYAQPKNRRAYIDKNIYDEQVLPQQLSDEKECHPVSGEELLFFSQPGVQERSLKQLRQGELLIEDHLDLHGLSIDEARQSLLEFINFARKQQIRCIRLVHGKGYRSNTQAPILKNKINNWLRQHPDILAFSSAQPKDGGAGAVYIIIKK